MCNKYSLLDNLMEIVLQFHHWDNLRDPGFEYPPEPEPDFLKNQNDEEDCDDKGDAGNGNDQTPNGMFYNAPGPFPIRLILSKTFQQTENAQDIDAIPEDKAERKRWWYYIFTVLSDNRQTKFG